MIDLMPGPGWVRSDRFAPRPGTQDGPRPRPQSLTQRGHSGALSPFSGFQAISVKVRIRETRDGSQENPLGIFNLVLEIFGSAPLMGDGHCQNSIINLILCNSVRKEMATNTRTCLSLSHHRSVFSRNHLLRRVGL